MKKFAMALFIIAFSAFISLSVYAQDINVYVDSYPVSFSSQQPVISNGRTLVPLRGLFDLMGYEISWNGSTKTAALSRSGANTIKITIGAENYTVGGEAFSLDTPAQIINGSTMIPLRAVAEATGSAVYWDNDTKSIYIYMAFYPNILAQSENTKFIGTATLKHQSFNKRYLLVQSTDILASDGETYIPFADVLSAVSNVNSSYSGSIFNMNIEDYGIVPNINISLNTESGEFSYDNYTGSIASIVENEKVYVKASDIINILGWWCNYYIYDFDTLPMDEYLVQNSDCTLILPYSWNNIDLSKVNQINDSVIIALGVPA